MSERMRQVRRDGQSAELIVTSGRFYVVDAATGCWDWTRATNNYGYGQVCCLRKQVSAHRLFYEFYKGPIGVGLQIDHLCRNRRCVNPSHLEAVTPRENLLRGNSPCAVAVRTGRCIRGHDLALAAYMPSGRRYCRQCSLERDRKRHAAKRKAGAA